MGSNTKVPAFGCWTQDEFDTFTLSPFGCWVYNSRGSFIGPFQWVTDKREMTRSTQESQRFFSTQVSFQQYGWSLKLKLILLKALIRCIFASTQASGLLLFYLGMYKSFNIYHLEYSLINGSFIMRDWSKCGEVCKSHKISWIYPKPNLKT